MDAQERAERIAALHEQVAQQVQALSTGEAWREMLRVAATFPRYSLRNQLLVMSQAAERGFNPRQVAGFGQWRSVDRSVRRGERGLAILAPCTYTYPTSTDTDQVPALANLEQEAGPQQTRRLRGFRVVHVFDVSQTEGADLPEVAPQMLTGQAPARLWEALAAQVTAHGYSLERGDCGGANGWADGQAKVVRVRDDVDDAQAVKTLAHELAHIECAHTENHADYQLHRGRMEAEAESVAYIVTTWAGLDSGAYTVPYVATWAGGEPQVVRAAADTVTAAARRIIDALDPHPTESQTAALAA